MVPPPWGMVPPPWPRPPWLHHPAGINPEAPGQSSAPAARGGLVPAGGEGGTAAAEVHPALQRDRAPCPPTLSAPPTARAVPQIPPHPHTAPQHPGTAGASRTPKAGGAPWTPIPAPPYRTHCPGTCTPAPRSHLHPQACSQAGDTPLAQGGPPTPRGVTVTSPRLGPGLLPPCPNTGGHAQGDPKGHMGLSAPPPCPPPSLGSPRCPCGHTGAPGAP